MSFGSGFLLRACRPTASADQLLYRSISSKRFTWVVNHPGRRWGGGPLRAGGLGGRWGWWIFWSPGTESTRPPPHGEFMSRASARDTFGCVDPSTHLQGQRDFYTPISTPRGQRHRQNNALQILRKGCPGGKPPGRRPSLRSTCWWGGGTHPWPMPRPMRGGRGGGCGEGCAGHQPKERRKEGGWS